MEVGEQKLGEQGHIEEYGNETQNDIRPAKRARVEPPTVMALSGKLRDKPHGVALIKEECVTLPAAFTT
jgi:hypothetical protein